MKGRFGPIVIFKCKFCGEEHESPWAYTPWPPLNMEDYFAWWDMVKEYEEDAKVECVCHKCQSLGCELEENTKQISIMEREDNKLDKILEGVA